MIETTTVDRKPGNSKFYPENRCFLDNGEPCQPVQLPNPARLLQLPIKKRAILINILYCDLRALPNIFDPHIVLVPEYL